MRNVVLDMVRKMLQTLYQKVLQYSLFLWHNKLYLLEVLQNDVKYLGIFQNKHFKKRITQ